MQGIKPFSNMNQDILKNISAAWSKEQT